MEQTEEKTASNVPVTVIVSRKVKAGREEDFETWVKGISEAAAKFPGHEGVTVTRPSKDNQEEYVLIFRFDSYPHLKVWEDSDIRKDWLEKVKLMSQGEAHVEKVTGLEYWFQLPGNAAKVPPPPYKMVVATIIGIYPTTLAVNMLIGPRFVAIPLYPRVLILVIITVSLMTYVVMPLVTRFLARWLFANRK
jgi:antibiotic biosynthesis monooxygenase (ABM) superfamily enzyme